MTIVLTNQEVPDIFPKAIRISELTGGGEDVFSDLEGFVSSLFPMVKHQIGTLD